MSTETDPDPAHAFAPADAARCHLQQRGDTFPSAWVTPEVQRAMPKPKGLPITLVRGRDGRIVVWPSGDSSFPRMWRASRAF